MKSLLTIPVNLDFEILVVKGNKVKSGDILAKKKVKILKEKIPLAKILSVPPPKIPSYLKQKVGGKVKKGEILAKKEGILKSIQVLSPFSGLIDSIDLKDGSLLLSLEDNLEIFEKSPIEGLIEEVNKDGITISFEGKVIKAEKGRGSQVIGEILVFEKNLDIFDFASEVDQKIVVAYSFTETARAKLFALGAKGLISFEFYEDFPNLVKISKDQLKEILEVYKTNLIIRGDKKQVIIPM